MTRWASISLAMLLVAAAPAQAITINLLPATQEAGNGDTVMVDLVFGDLGAAGAPSLGAFDVDIAFDSSALAFQGGTTGGDLGGSIDSYLAAGNVLDAFAVSLLPPLLLDSIQTDTVVGASLEFLVRDLAPGASTTLSVIGTDPFLAISDGLGSALPVTGLSAATITATAVVIAEPATMALLGLGLAGIGFARRRARPGWPRGTI